MTIEIEVVFAPTAEQQLLKKLTVADPITPKQVVELLGWQDEFSEIFGYQVGIFSQKIDWDTPLKTGDRLEIYRPLTINPMQKRAKKMTAKAKKGYVIMKV